MSCYHRLRRILRVEEDEKGVKLHLALAWPCGQAQVKPPRFQVEFGALCSFIET